MLSSIINTPACIYFYLYYYWNYRHFSSILPYFLIISGFMPRPKKALSTFALVTRMMFGLGACYACIRFGAIDRFQPTQRVSLLRTMAPLLDLWLAFFVLWGILLWRWISALDIVTYQPVTTSSGTTLDRHPAGQTDAGHHQWSLELLQTIEWQRFELLCAAYFEALGFSAKTQSHGPDGGIDIHLGRPGMTHYRALAQCKAWNTNTVGSAQVREFFGVMSKENVDKGFYLTTGKYAPGAIQFAAGTHLHLTDGAALLDRILMLPPDTQAALLQIASAP